MRTKGVISHLVKCFSYAVASNEKHSDKIAEALLSIPDHVYGKHEKCGIGCRSSTFLDYSIKSDDDLFNIENCDNSLLFYEDPEENSSANTCTSTILSEKEDISASSPAFHTILLIDPNLYEKLQEFFSVYASNAEKFSVSASSQRNECLNGMIA